MGKGKAKRKRRFLKSKIIYGTLAVFLLVTAGGRIWWGWYADRTLDDIVSRIRDRGEPLEWAEMAPPAVPDDRNAALLYERAILVNPLIADPERRISKNTAYYESIRPASVGPLDYEGVLELKNILDELESRDVRKFIIENAVSAQQILKFSAGSLELCRRARDLPQSNWGMDFTGPAILTFSPPMSCYRSIARLLSLAAIDAHTKGQDGEAVEYVMDMLHMADCIDQMPGIIPQLVAIAIDSTASMTVEAMAFDLRVGTATGEATPQQVSMLAEKLLDWQPRFAKLKKAFIAERSIGYDTFEWFRRSDTKSFEDVDCPNSNFATHFVFGPMWKLDEARYLRIFEPMVLSAGEPTQKNTRLSGTSAAKKSKSTMNSFSQTRI